MLAPWKFLTRSRHRRAARAARAPSPLPVQVRISAPMFERLRAHVENFSRGEEAAFLICSIAALEERDVLLVRELEPIPDATLARGSEGSVLSWTAQFNSHVLERAVGLDCTAVLVHSHGSPIRASPGMTYAASGPCSRPSAASSRRFLPGRSFSDVATPPAPSGAQASTTSPSRRS